MKPDPEKVRNWGELASIGPLLAASVIVGWLLGSYADKHLGTEPWGLVTGVLLGTAAGFVQLVKMLNRIGGSGRKKRSQRGPGEGQP